jgi:hypothetical protein
VKVAAELTFKVTLLRSGCGRFGLPSPVRVIELNNGASAPLKLIVPVLEAGQEATDAPSTVIVQVNVACAMLLARISAVPASRAVFSMGKFLS